MAKNKAQTEQAENAILGMSSKNRQRAQPAQPSYAHWRAELLAKLALSRLANVSVTEHPREGLFDFYATASGSVTFFVEVKAFSSIRQGIHNIEKIDELSYELSTAVLRKAKSVQMPVMLFVFDADTEHGRFLRLDLLEPKEGGLQSQSVHLPRQNTIGTQSLYRMIEELRPQSEQQRVPEHSEMVFIFDTNAYRELTSSMSLETVRENVRHLRDREQKARCAALAHPIVIWELLCHLTGASDPAYLRCLTAVVALGEHTASRQRRDGSIDLIADQLSSVCRELFGRLPPGYESGLQNLGSLVSYIVRNAPAITDPVALKNIDTLARGMAAKEAAWVKGMEDILDHFSPAAAKAVFGEKRDDVALKKARDFFSSELFMQAWATYIVVSNAAEVGILSLPPHEIEQKAVVVRKLFPVPFQLMSAILRKLATPQFIRLSRPARKNFVWDSMLSFAIGPGTIAGRPVSIVTADREIAAAADAAGFRIHIWSLQSYFEHIGMN